MDFELSDTQALVRDTTRDFVQKRLMPVAAELDQKERFPAAELKALAELGMMGVNIPEELGGSAAGVVAYSLAMTEVARGCASTAVTMAVTNMVGEVIAAFGSEEQRSKYVPKLTSGEYVAGSFALSEPEAGSDPGSMRTTARRDGDYFVLDGPKQWITSGAHAGVFVVWARTGEQSAGTRAISCFLVEGGTPGLRIGKHEDKMGIRASNTVALSFEGVRIPASALLGELNGGFKIAMMALDGGRIGIASQAIGIATAALEEATAYAKDRRQFGRPIGDFQGIQWQLADCKTELEAARVLVLRAAWLKENGRPFSKEAAMAKLYASEASNRIVDRCLQIHGGYGYVKEFPIERHYRDARVTRIYEGTSEVQRVVIARQVTAAK
jgi:alkylation response protein AidB-like acyl-CoA dehydrogenase